MSNSASTWHSLSRTNRATTASSVGADVRTMKQSLSSMTLSWNWNSAAIRQSLWLCCGCLLSVYVNEVIRPNRKFFGRTKQFYTDYVILDQYSSIDEAVKSVIAEGLKVEEQTKQVNKKWEEWSKETN